MTTPIDAAKAAAARGELLEAYTQLGEVMLGDDGAARAEALRLRAAIEAALAKQQRFVFDALPSNQVAHALVDALRQAEPGVAFFIGHAHTARDDDQSVAAIGIQAGPRQVRVALLWDFPGQDVWVFTLAPHGKVRTLRLPAGAPIAPAVAAIRDALGLHAHGLTPLDAAVRLHQLLQLNVPIAKGWQLGFGGYSTTPLQDGALQISIPRAPPNFILYLRNRNGLEVEPLHAPGEPHAPMHFAAIADFEAALPNLLAQAGRVVAAYTKHEQSSVALWVGGMTADAFRAAGIPVLNWTCNDLFPVGNVRVSLWSSKRMLLEAAGDDARTELHIASQTWTVRTVAELQAALPALTAAAMALEATRPPVQLTQGGKYRVLRPFGGLAVGDVITLLAQSWDHDDLFEYVTLDTPRGPLQLSGHNAPEILGHDGKSPVLDSFLDPV